MYYSNFTERLKEALKDSGLTQSQLAQRTNLDKSLISNYLAGNFKPKQDKLYVLAKALNVEPAWLMGYDVNKSTNELLQDKDIALCNHIKNLSKNELEEELLIKCTMLEEENQNKILEIVNMYLKEQGDYYIQDENGRWVDSPDNIEHINKETEKLRKQFYHTGEDNNEEK